MAVEVQRYHSHNPLDPRATPGIMYPAKDGEWVLFRDYERVAKALKSFLNDHEFDTEAPDNCSPEFRCGLCEEGHAALEVQP